MDFKNVEYVRNYDGDTITVNIPEIHPLLGDKIPVRIRGIDTEEIRSKSEKSIEAKFFVEGVMSSANTIDLMDASRGKYFRIVADVIVDGFSLASLLVERGFAKEVDY